MAEGRDAVSTGIGEHVPRTSYAGLGAALSQPMNGHWFRLGGEYHSRLESADGTNLSAEPFSFQLGDSADEMVHLRCGAFYDGTDQSRSATSMFLASHVTNHHVYVRAATRTGEIENDATLDLGMSKPVEDVIDILERRCLNVSRDSMWRQTHQSPFRRLLPDRPWLN
jgi:hypothetical protein